MGKRKLASRAAVLIALHAAAAGSAWSQGTQPALLRGATLTGTFGDWRTFNATPGGKRVCFALAQPAAPARDNAYAFVSNRPADRVVNEVFFMTGHQQKKGPHATVTIDGRRFAMYTEDDGAWVHDEALAPRFVDAMRRGSEMRIESASVRGDRAVDVYSLKGVSLALDKVAQECR